jgi:hypothetical protein
MSTPTLCRPKVTQLPSHMRLKLEAYTEPLDSILPQRKKSSNFELQELRSLTFTDQKHPKPFPTLQETTKLKKTISRAILENNQNLLISSLIDIQRYSITKDLLKSTKLLKTLKFFIKNTEKNEKVLFDGLLDVTKYIFYRWKLMLIQKEEIFDHKKDDERSHLRQGVIKMVKKVLGRNGFDNIEAEKLAVTIEDGLSKRDPDVDEKYKLLARAMLKDIKHLDKHSFEKVCAN